MNIAHPPYLVEAGAELSVENRDGFNALQIAYENDALDCMEILQNGHTREKDEEDSSLLGIQNWLENEKLGEAIKRWYEVEESDLKDSSMRAAILLLKARGNLISTENFALDCQEKLKVAVQMWNTTAPLQCEYCIFFALYSARSLKPF